MRRTVSHWLLASLFLCVAATLPNGAAAKTTYTCFLQPVAGAGWIPGVLFIGVDPARDRVVVSDPIVLHFNDRKPVDGRIAVDTDKRITFAWDYRAKDKDGNRAKLTYQATWNKSSQEMRILAAAAGRPNQFQGKGRCKKANL